MGRKFMAVQLLVASLSFASLFGIARSSYAADTQAPAAKEAAGAAKDSAPAAKETAGAARGTSADQTVDVNKGRVIFETERTYQARGGEVRFAVTGDPKSQPDVQACLRWKTPNADVIPPGWSCGANDTVLPVRTVKVNTDTLGVVYAITIPRSFAPPTKSAVEYLVSMIPIAQLVISTGPGGTAPHHLREIGITSQLLAGLAAITSILLAGTVLYRFAVYLGVPGPEIPKWGDYRGMIRNALRGFSVPLRIISTANGWASLSQFQTILWTFVVGAGAVYVMTLNGSLIVIGTGTLALLGIAGAATVLSEVKGSQPSPGSGAVLPDVVTGLSIVGTASATEVRVSWFPPKGGANPTGYVVQYQDPAMAGVWRTATTVSRGRSSLRDTRFRLIDLKPGTAYLVQVIAINDAGSGPAASIAAPTLAHPLPPGSAVTGLHSSGMVTGTTVTIAWTSVPGATYIVEVRPHDGDADWLRVETGAREASATVPSLTPNTAYDFRVSTTAAPDDWSSVLTVTSGIRIPRWSDIVTDADKPAEIDVTRVQMLFFTVISAIFVALNIIDTGTIPAIDASYVALMGISNGLYVTAKFVRS